MPDAFADSDLDELLLGLRHIDSRLVLAEARVRAADTGDPDDCKALAELLPELQSLRRCVRGLARFSNRLARRLQRQFENEQLPDVLKRRLPDVLKTLTGPFEGGTFLRRAADALRQGPAVWGYFCAAVRAGTA